jgi:hypothetical protein
MHQQKFALKIAFLIPAALLLNACGHKATHEISTNVSAIGTVPVEDLLLNGVQIGDSPSRIPQNIVTRSMPGYVLCGTVGYKTMGDITGFVLLDSPLLDSLNLHSPKDITDHFGPADAVLKLGDIAPMTRYTYKTKKLQITWSDSENRLNQVELGELAGQ